MTCHVIIPAAGVGSRMGADIPKQYLPLKGQTVIDCTIQRLLSHSALIQITLVLAANDHWWNDTLYAQNPKVNVVMGGSERCHSVLNGLAFLMQDHAEDDWVLVHDAARPCVRLSDIDKLIQTVGNHPTGGLLGMPVRDTMKRSDEAGAVLNTVDRNELWHAFTPQMFRLGALHTALSQAIEAGVQVTDEASAMEWAGHAPQMVEGHADNIKITLPADLTLAEFYLSR